MELIPTKPVPARNVHRADDRTGTAQDVDELPAPSARDRDLVHDAARRAHHAVLRDLPELRDARRVQTEAEAGVEGAQRADLHRGRTGDAGVHRHRTQEKEVEAGADPNGFLLQQREEAAPRIGRPRGERVVAIRARACRRTKRSSPRDSKRPSGMHVSTGRLRGPIGRVRMRNSRSFRGCTATRMPWPSVASQTFAPE